MIPTPSCKYFFQFCRVFLLIFLFVSSSRAAAQQPRVLAPHKPVAPKLQQPRLKPEPAVPRTLVGGPWMIDPNLKSSIYISNNLETSPLTVTPVLWLSNGGKYALPPVDLAPGGTTIVDINDGLAQQGIAPYATLSGYVELDYDWAWDALCAMVRNVDFLRSVIFQFNLQFSVPSASPANGNSSGASQDHAQTQTLEGLWWKQEPNVNAFVALSNPTAQPVSANVTTTDQRGNPLSQYSQTISPHGTKLLTLGELPQSAGSSGGIQVTYAGAENALLVSGGLRDDSSGYSANIPFAPPPASSAQPSTVSYAELGLMAGAADPMMNFPAGTLFTPFSVLRNISGQPVSVTPNLYWMAGGMAQTARLPQITLAPLQTQVLDVMALLAQAGQKNYNGSLSLVLDVASNVPRGAVLLAGGSVDQTNNYVFQVIAQGIRESVSKTVSYWNTANGNDTMVTLWNPADEAQDFVFTLLYATGHYLHPIHLEPRATLTFNVSELLHNPTPDAEGNVIPAGLSEGRARIAGTLGNSQHILVALDSGTYNVQKATCGTNCHNCDGIVSSSVVVDPFAVAVGGTYQLSFIEKYNTGTQYNATDISAWSSSNTSVASVSTGLVTGVSPGSINVLANDSDSPDFFRNCTGQYLDCPVTVGAGGGSSGNSNPTVTLSNTPLAPIGKPVPITATVSPSTNTVQITLTISTTSGTGSATFVNGSTTMTITTTTTLTVIGVTASSVPNNIQLSATIPSEGSGGTLATTTFTVTGPINGAIPVNFRQTAAYVNPGAILHFEYDWDSSSGNKADLSSCQVEEYVTYVGPNPYPWASPPYLPGYTTPWPELGGTPISATLSLQDNHGHAPGWQTPYAFNFIAADQKYQFQCPYYQNNQWVQLMPTSGTMPISRVVNLTNGALPWTYQITKSNLTGSINLP